MSDQKQKISFVQVNFQLGPTELNSYHLPYTVGCLWAYARSQSDICERYELNQLIWKRDAIDDVVVKLQNDTLVGFSTYVWNLQYNLHLAQRLRQINPQCYIIFGGPEPAVSDRNFFQKYQFIDAVVRHEGETTFSQLLKNLPDIGCVPGLLYNDNGRSIDTGPAGRIDDLSLLPSPYTSGCFDQLIIDNPQVKWAATLETNRGCPYACTFCDWGSLTLSKIKKFPIEKVYGELEWMSEKRVDFVSIADANFGIFADRDRSIIEKFIDLQRYHGAPAHIIANFAKNQNQEVIEIVELLIKQTLHPTTGLKISLQTLNSPSLELIKRQNLKINNLSDIVKIGQEKNIPIGTELILGLPGETLSSWTKNFYKLLEIGIHEDIDVYHCQILENAEMNLVQKRIYQIETCKIYDYFSPLADENTGACAESVEVVKATVDMSFEDLVQASLVSWNFFTWHVGGYSDIAARFLRKYLDLSYENFYQSLFDRANELVWYRQLRDQQRDILIDWFSKGRCISDSGIPGIKLYGNSIIFHTRMLLSANPDRAEVWYKFMSEFLLEFGLDPKLHQDIIDLQRNQVIDIATRQHYPRQKTFAYNVWEFINQQKTDLSQSPSVLQFDFPEANMSDLEFLERIFWSRKRRFGRSWITVL